MRNLTRALLISAAMLTSVSAGPQSPGSGTKSSGIEAAVSNPKTIPDVFIPPTEIKIFMKDWEWINMGLTGRFNIDVRYTPVDGKKIVAHYRADSQYSDKWFRMTRTGLESELPSNLQIHEVYTPPSKISIYLADWSWMTMNLTGKFRIDVEYSAGDGEDVLVHYQAMSQQKDGGFVMYRKSYNIRDVNESDVRVTK